MKSMRRLQIESLEHRQLLTTTTLEVRLAASSDDAEERPSGSVKLTSSDLEMTQDKANQQIVGMRFSDLNIPPDASIQNAYLQFQADETASDPTSLTIYAEAVDDAATFTSTNGNISSRTTTTAFAAWAPAPWNVKGEAGPDQQTPNIAAVIQEIVSRPGWSTGNSLAIIVTGTGKRTAESFNGVPAAAPLLHVEYVTAGGNVAPTTSGIANVNVNTDAPDTVLDLFAAFDDFEDPDSALTYTIENNTNPALFTSTTIDGVPGTLTLDYTAATNGTAEITVRATDTGTPALLVETTFTVSVSPVNQTPTTLNVRVAASSDDAEERPSGSVTLTSSDLELTQDKTNQQIVGMRFTDLNIPPGASIQNAHLQFQADETASDPTSLTIYAEAVDNAPTFTSTSGNISSRNTTSAFTTWSPAPWNVRGEAGPDQQTPNFAAVIQEIVSRPGWSIGNSLAIIVSGTGKRTAESFNGVPAAAPLLHVEFVTGGNVTPTTSGIANVNVITDAADTELDLFAAFDDFEDPDSALTYTIENNTNPGLFTSTTIDGVLGTLTLDYAAATNGVAEITVRATDTGTPALLVETTFTVSVSPVSQTNIVDVRVAARSDDAEERFSGVVKFVSKDLDLVDDPTQSGVQQTAGIRFNDLAIPQGAVITHAHVQFEASATDDDVTTLLFNGEDTDNAATFDTTDFNVTSRPVTNATVAWSPPDWTTAGEAGVDQQTPNIAPVIQEIVDRAGWAAGNSLALLITGFGERAAVSYDGDVVNGTSGAPLLHVEYTVAQSPLRLKSTVRPPVGAQPIDKQQLAPIFDEAKSLLQSSHADMAIDSANDLANLDIQVVDLPGNMLGRVFRNKVQIDVNAAGFGWFVDATPNDNVEFDRVEFDRVEFSRESGSQQFLAAFGSPASERVDLLTVVLHELGHVLGFEHSHSGSLMQAELPLGTRRLPNMPSDLLSDVLGAELTSQKVDNFYQLVDSFEDAADRRRHLYS